MKPSVIRSRSGRAVFLHDAEEAVVVGEEEAGIGDETGGAAAGADGGGQQAGAAGGIPEAGDGEFEALLLEPGGVELEQLLGRPLALLGAAEGDGEAETGRPPLPISKLHKKYQDKPWRVIRY